MAFRLKSAFVLLCFFFSLVACRKESVEYTDFQETQLEHLPISAIHFISPDTGFVAMGSIFTKGVLYQTTDAGVSWQRIFERSNGIASIDYNQGELSIALFGQEFWFTENYNDWRIESMLGWTNVHKHLITDDKSLVVVGGENFSTGSIHKRDTANAYNLIDSVFEYELQDIAQRTTNELYAVGYGTVLRTIDYGSTWEVLPVYGDFFRTVAFPTPKIGYIVGEQGTIFKTTDGGQEWKRIQRRRTLFKAPQNRYLTSSFQDENTGFIAGGNGTLLRTANGGETWNPLKALAAQHNFLTSTFNNKYLYLGTESGRIIRLKPADL